MKFQMFPGMSKKIFHVLNKTLSNTSSLNLFSLIVKAAIVDLNLLLEPTGTEQLGKHQDSKWHMTAIYRLRFVCTFTSDPVCSLVTSILKNFTVLQFRNIF